MYSTETSENRILIFAAVMVVVYIIVSAVEDFCAS